MSLRYSLKQIEAFAALASLGSFTAAADKLNVSRPALAATVDALEAALGERLLNRVRSIGVTLTPAGQRFLPGALSLLHDAQQLGHAIRPEQDLTGELAIGATVSLAPTLLPDVLERLARKHPRLKVRVVIRSADELLSMLQRGSIEVLFSYATSTPLQRLEMVPLFPSRFGVLTRADAGSAEPAGTTTMSVDSLIGTPLVILDNPISRQRLFEYLASAGGIEVDIRYRVGALALCVELVRRGLATALVPLFPAFLLELPNDIRWFDLDPAPTPLMATCSWTPDVTLSPAAAALVAEVGAVNAESGW